MKSQSMRDAFWDRVYELAKEDPDIVIVSADFGAPSLDKFRRDFPKQYVNTGISEQNAVLLASGLALEGKKPIAYAITQFITLRCFEQIRIYPCGMRLPVVIAGVGAGACYWESGSTHHSLEQLSVMRALPNLEIINCSSQRMATEMADYAARGAGPLFLQMDREIIYGIHERPIDFKKGFQRLGSRSGNLVVATGNMVNEALRIKDGAQKEYDVLDLYKMPAQEEALAEELKKAGRILTLEENTLSGGVGSYILELLSDRGISVPVCRMGLNTGKGYGPSYRYGGREQIRGGYGLGRERILAAIGQFFE